MTYFALKLLLALHPIAYFAGNVVFMYTCLAAHCLSAEGLKVYNLLQKGDLESARKQTSMIVGRDTEQLDEGELTRAVVETVAENASDGIIAPLIYMAVGGAPLGMAYKAINTLDSMVGYKNERFIDFGWCSARLDDAANYIPARLTAAAMALGALLTGFNFRESVSTMLSEGRNHSSPNSGYPEAAAAGALGIQLGGTNLYFGKPVHKPTIGKASRPLNKRDIVGTIKLVLTAYGLSVGLISILYFAGR